MITGINQRVLAAICAERERQDEQWGGPAHDDQHGPLDWRDFIVHQAECLEERLEAIEQNRGRYVKIAAMAIAAIESYDRITG